MDEYSVLTTVYINDKVEFLKQSVESMLNQTYKTNDYCIVVDGEIDSDVEEYLLFLEHNFEFVNVYFLKNNVGLGSALNFGLNKCKNEFIARLDSDDYSKPERCIKQMEMFQKFSDLVIVGSDIIEFGEDLTGQFIKKMPENLVDIKKYGKRRNPFNHSSVMYKKSYILKLGGYSSIRRTQDFDLFARVLHAGYQARNIPLPLVYFRSGSDRIRRKSRMKNIKYDIYVANKLLRIGYFNIFNYSAFLIKNIMMFVLPNKILIWLFFKMYRRKNNSEVRK